MAADGKSRSSDDIWHLGIEDLFAADERGPRTASAGPFVINLRTSQVPIGPPPKALLRFEPLRAYQLTRTNDGRPQYLLRLGIIETELEADSILEQVREHYPRAATESAVAEDHDAFAEAAPAVATPAVATPAAAAPAPPRRRPLPPPPPIMAPPPARTAPKPPEPFRIDIDDLLPELKDLEVTAAPIDELRDVDPDAVTDQVEALVIEDLPGVAEASAASDVVGPREAPEVERPPIAEMATVVEPPPIAEPQPIAEPPLIAEPLPVVEPPAVAVTAAAPCETPLANAEPAIEQAPVIGPLVPSAAPAPGTVPAAPLPAGVHPGSPAVDSTQTLRALTPIELADDEASHWFAIQLSLGEEPIDADQVPNLDIFDEYRLYAVTGLHDDRIMHALRVGFFSSKLAAETVAGYLATFFESPCIKRISIAERERFDERRIRARKDVGAAGAHTAIELADPTPAKVRRADSAHTDGARSRAAGSPSLWSRLVAPRGR